MRYQILAVWRGLMLSPQLLRISKNDVDIRAYCQANGRTSFKKTNIVPTEPGANLLVVDLEPDGTMHRTISIDFSICCIGEIDHELDGGEKVRLHPGVSIQSHIPKECTEI